MWGTSHTAVSSKSIQILFCLLLGIASAVLLLRLTPVSFILAMIGMLAFFASVSRPEIGILIIVVIISTIIFEESLPLIPIAVGSFHVTDVLLLFLLFMILFRLVTDKSFSFLRTPLDTPLFLFFLAAIVSASVAVVYFKLDFNIVMREFRVVTYYLIFFVITNHIREKKKIKFVIKGLFVIAAVVGITMLIQAIVGESVRLMPGRVEAAATLGQVYGATRILPPGQTLIYVIFITAVCSIVFMNKPILKSGYFYAFLVAGIGVLLTYNRSYWVSIAFSLSILMVMMSKGRKKRFIAWLMILFVLVGLVSYTLVNVGGRPREFLFSVSDRFISLFAGRYIFYSATLEWRKIEIGYALNRIAKQPLWGIGVGNSYRPGGKWSTDKGTYIHNGYLWILLKMGLIGFIPFLWFYFRFLYDGFSHWKRINDATLKSAVAGFTLASTGILLAVMVNPMFMQWFSIVVIATMMGLTEAIIRINERDVEQSDG